MLGRSFLIWNSLLQVGLSSQVQSRAVPCSHPAHHSHFLFHRALTSLPHFPPPYNHTSTSSLQDNPFSKPFSFKKFNTMDAAAAADAPAGDGGRKDGPGGIKKKVAY
jgi:hypothetical protein